MPLHATHRLLRVADTPTPEPGALENLRAGRVRGAAVLTIADCGLQIEKQPNRQSQIRNPQLLHGSCQISTRFPEKTGISTRWRLPSYPMSAGLGTPAITFTSCPVS